MQEQVLTGGHGLMVQGYYPVVEALSNDIDIRLNHRYAWGSVKFEILFFVPIACHAVGF